MFNPEYRDSQYEAPEFLEAPTAENEASLVDVLPIRKSLQ